MDLHIQILLKPQYIVENTTESILKYFSNIE